MATKKTTKKVQYLGTGRRKTAIARVRLIPDGEGAIIINKRTLEEYFPPRYDEAHRKSAPCSYKHYRQV